MRVHAPAAGEQRVAAVDHRREQRAHRLPERLDARSDSPVPTLPISEPSGATIAISE